MFSGNQSASLNAALADRYRLERELGQGGMATVYLAHDLRHDRKVALKVLRPDLAAVIGAERFLQEIRTTANLQHPHILPLHDSGQVDGTVFYVMPYVDGESLRDRLNRDKQLPIDDAVRIAREVADALGYAHEHGIIHRDIKPENILLQRGHALVADFGIALAASRSGAASRMTETGMSLGTPTYMSPEQAMGERDLSARSDIYALGCVLHEMLTGEPPFDGPTAQAIVAKVLTDEPRPASQLRRSVPPNVEAAILTALEKVPADRFATAAAFANALGSPSFTHATPTRPLKAAALRPSLGRDPRTWITVAAVAAAAVLLVTRGTGRRADAAGPTMATLLPGPNETWDRSGSGLALSPDGRTVALVGSSSGSKAGLLLRSMDSLGTVRLRGTEGASYPFWSPDGKAIAFFADGQLKRLDLVSGSTRVLCPAPQAQGGSWGKNGDILYRPARGSTLHIVPSEGGACREVGLQTSEGAVAGRPYFFPDGKNFIATTDKMVWLGRLGDSSATKLLDLSAAEAVFAPPDYLLTRPGHGQGEGLFAQRIDLTRRQMIGSPQRMLDRIRTPGGHTVVSASSNGTLVAGVPGEQSGRRLAVLTRGSGRLDTLALETGAWMFRFSHDGRHLALGGWGLWQLDIARNLVSKLPVELDTAQVVMNSPIWSPGDSLLAVKRGYHDPGFTLLDTRTGRASRWFEEPTPGRSATTNDWSPDGRQLLLELDVGTAAAYSEIWLYDIATKSAKPLIAERGDVGEARFSSDGHWVAYRSNVDGEDQIYLRSFPGPGKAIRVSPKGGTFPSWRGDGRELFYLEGDGRIMAVEVPAGGVGVPGTPVLAAGGPALARGEGRNFRSFEPFPDGQRFAIEFNAGASPGLTLVLNWWKLLEHGK